ncbi:MAG: ABC transporter permease subunit [Balneolales bacterium]|nr:ABC transporter permease subunit [Balneolales bacterium]
MIRHILYYELKKSLADRWLWIVSIILIATTATGLYEGHRLTEARLNSLEFVRTQEANFYASQLERLKQKEAGEIEIENWWQDPANPLVLSAFGAAGKHVVIEPGPFSVLAAGQSDIFPFYGKVRLTASQPLRDNAFENPIHKLNGKFDLAFVLVWLLPLIVIALGYNLRSSERESGTLSLLQSMPVPVNTVLRAKIIYRYALISIITLSCLFGGLLLFGVPVFSLSGLGLAATVLLYLGFWFLLCYLINLTETSSAVNAVLLFGAWITLLLIVPSLLNTIANALHPVPSRAVWVTERRAIGQEATQKQDELVETYFANHPQEVPEEDIPDYLEIWNARLIRADYVRERQQQAQLAFEQPVQAQKALVNRLKYLSPPMLFQSYLEKLSGNNADRLRNLDHKMMAFQNEWNDFFVTRLQRLEYLTPEDFDQIPSP